MKKGFIFFCLTAICMLAFHFLGIGGTAIALAVTVPGMTNSQTVAKSLREERARMVKQLRDINDKAVTEKRSFSSEEQTQYDKLFREAEDKKKQYEQIERQLNLEAELGDVDERNADENGESKEERQEKRNKAFRHYLMRGLSDMNSEMREILNKDFRSLEGGTQAHGGYLVPAGFSQKLEVAMKEIGGIYGAGELIPTSIGNDIAWPTANDIQNKGRIIGEGQSVGKSKDPTFDNVILKAFIYTSDPVLVSDYLLEDSYFNLENVLAEMMAKRIITAFNEHAIAGTGTGQPQGILPGATKGADAAAVAITFDNLIDLKYSVNNAYRRNGSWVLNDETAKALVKIKNKDGDYIWRESVKAGEPDSLLGRPVIIADDMPTIKASAKSVAFGDLKRYKIRQVGNPVVRRLVERYADNMQTGFIMFRRMDGRLIDAGGNPIKFLQHANS